MAQFAMEQFNSPGFIKGIFDLVDQASSDVKKSLGKTKPEALRRLEESCILEDKDFRFFLFHFYEACGFMHRRLKSASQPGEEDSSEDIDAEMYACLFHALMEMEGHDSGTPAFVRIDAEDVMAFLRAGFQCFTALARSSVKDNGND